MNSGIADSRGILIVTDQPEESRTLQELLTNDMGQYWCVETDAEGVRLFTQKRPTLLILSYKKIASAERFFLMLHRQCPNIHTIRYQCLVFCTNQDAEAAFQLCRDGVVDDYVVNRPLFDPFRLRQSIHQAFAISTIKQQADDFRRNLADAGGDLLHLNEHMGKTLNTGKELQQETIRAFQEFTSRISGDMAQFEANLLESDMDKTVLDRTELQQKLNQLPRAYLEMERLHIEKKMHDAEALIRKADADFRQQADSLCTMEFPPVRKEVMVVDDEDVYRELIVEVLEETGFRATGAESGQIALSNLNNRRPNLILLDFQMPGLNGLETLLRIKSDPDLHAIPVIMLTGASEKTLVQECIMAGAVDFIVKPGDRDTLVSKINAHL